MAEGVFIWDFLPDVEEFDEELPTDGDVEDNLRLPDEEDPLWGDSRLEWDFPRLPSWEIIEEDFVLYIFVDDAVHREVEVELPREMLVEVFPIERFE